MQVNIQLDANGWIILFYFFLLYAESTELQHYVGFNTYSEALEQRAMPRKVMNAWLS